MRARRWSAVPSLALCLTPLAACAPAAPAPTPAATATALPAGVSVELRQARSDVAARQASVRVINASDQELRIGPVSVVDPRFEAPAERLVDRSSRLRPGGAVDVHLQLAPVACGPGIESQGDQATVTLQYERDGVATVARVPITDPVPFVAALHERECLHERVLQAATIAFGSFAPSPAGMPAELTLEIGPPARAEGEGRPGPAVRLVGIRETNLLTFEGLAPPGMLPLDIDIDGRPATVPLPLLPARCDPHAVLEDKRGSVFRVLAEVDGAEGSFDLAASEELRGRLLDWVAAWCGYGVD